MKTKQADNQAALIEFLTHEIESAIKEQAAFSEIAANDVESALQWRAAGALAAVFTERYARTAREQVKLGRELRPVYENLIDRLTMLASGHSASSAEMRAIATLARSLKEWLP